MVRRDIYEHLAEIYLDTSVKKRNKHKEYPRHLKIILTVTSAFILISVTFLFANIYNKGRYLNSHTALVLQPDTVKINFNLDSAKKQAYSIGLNKLDLNKFKALSFSVKKANYRNNISLRVEFANAFKEKSEVYVKGVPDKWQEYKIGLSDFKNISDWSDMLDLSFVIEEWNTAEKGGVIYIDNIGLLH
jgi:preprotein translocase subunit SecF